MPEKKSYKGCEERNKVAEKKITFMLSVFIYF